MHWGLQNKSSNISCQTITMKRQVKMVCTSKGKKKVIKEDEKISLGSISVIILDFAYVNSFCSFENRHR